MKKVTFLFLMNIGVFSFAQVGINTTSPDAVLDIEASDVTAPASTDGILIPRLDNLPATNPGANQNAMMIYLNIDRPNVNITGTPKNYDKGFYYWDDIENDWINITSTLTPDAATSGWDLNGNSVANANFLGTTNNKPLKINVNNALRFRLTQAGQIIPVNSNNAIMIGDNTVGSAGNTIAIGNDAAASATSGVAIGEAAIASGGSNTTAVGARAEASANNSSSYGADSSAYGASSVAIGAFSAANTRAIAVGYDADASGENSVRLGYEGSATATGAIALGYQTNATATNAIAIGNTATSAFNNSIALGFGATTNAVNQLRLGGISEFDLNGATVSNASDGRFKYNVQDNIPGLAFIMDLKPVTYNFDYKKYNRFHNQEGFERSEDYIESGFIAQEVEASAKKTGYNFDGVIVPKDKTKQNYRLSYSKFVVPLVKSVQEQQEEIEALKGEYAQLKERIQNISKQ